MRKASIILFYTAGTLMLIGGIGDQFINKLLDVHQQYLGNPEPSEFMTKAESLLILMLHSVGGGLISAGVSMLALTHFGIRNDLKWTVWTTVAVAFIAQGFNGYSMYSAGSYYYYPLAILILTGAAAILYKKYQ